MSIAKPLLLLVTLTSLALLTVGLGLAQGPGPNSAPPPATPAFVPGEIVVKFQKGVDALGAQRSLQAEGLLPLELLPHSGAIRTQVVPGREAEMITQLLARGDVEFATYNYYVQALDDPDDPDYGLQWALEQPNDKDIDAPEAWEFHTGSSNVTIAVLDTGIDLDHPDLQAKILPGYDYVNKDNDPADDNGHGTHVAGIAAAATNNKLGVAGVSWGASLMPLKILDSAGNGKTADVAEAIHYAVDHGVRIINMSLGAKNSKWPCTWPDIEAAFNYAVNHEALLVVAAGNDGQNGVNCPGAYAQAMAVGSTTSTDERSFFSNYGSDLDIAAPGSNIYSTIFDVNPAGPGTYGYRNGTSMATPYVAGLAALLWSLKPGLTLSEVRYSIETTAKDLGPAGWDEFFGHGRINARAALESVILQTTPPETTILVDSETFLPISSHIEVTATLSELITWTATISPTVPWLALTPPTSGVVSAASPPALVTLVATRPVTYGVYTTTVFISGTTASGQEIGPRMTTVSLNYMIDLYRYYFPIHMKN